MRVCVIDGRGGGLGRRLILGLLPRIGREHELVALATNRAAAAAMRHAGGCRVDVGEGAIARTVPAVSVIVASLNVVLPGSMLGEITPGIAEAILRATARKLLLPVNGCKVEVVGTDAFTLEKLIHYAIDRVQTVLRAAASI
ncbi:MAG TPA: DUF3842 family protein [Nitrospiraceae bacterium]|jgi:hypothetical protein|nr:DUF3842 family protein [Nitrospiraceae bacterium]